MITGELQVMMKITMKVMVNNSDTEDDEDFD